MPISLCSNFNIVTVLSLPLSVRRFVIETEVNLILWNSRTGKSTQVLHEWGHSRINYHLLMRLGVCFLWMKPESMPDVVYSNLERYILVFVEKKCLSFFLYSSPGSHGLTQVTICQREDSWQVEFHTAMRFYKVTAAGEKTAPRWSCQALTATTFAWSINNSFHKKTLLSQCFYDTVFSQNENRSRNL